jgi:hypothetical protein
MWLEPSQHYALAAVMMCLVIPTVNYMGSGVPFSLWLALVRSDGQCLMEEDHIDRHGRWARKGNSPTAGKPRVTGGILVSQVHQFERKFASPIVPGFTLPWV